MSDRQLSKLAKSIHRLIRDATDAPGERTRNQTYVLALLHSALDALELEFRTHDRAQKVSLTP